MKLMRRKFSKDAGSRLSPGGRFKTWWNKTSAMFEDAIAFKIVIPAKAGIQCLSLCIS